jgi:Protein of unknown function (DUF1569)
MKSLFDKDSYDEINHRLNSLSPASQKQWGKMEVAQMLAHCKAAFSVPLSDKKMPRSLMGLLIGWMIKSKLYNDDPWKKSLPTAPQFIIKDERNFENEKLELSGLINTFYSRGMGNVGKFPHPMFGSFTQPQWGQAMYKHLDHHLRQFGV